MIFLLTYYLHWARRKGNWLNSFLSNVFLLQRTGTNQQLPVANCILTSGLLSYFYRHHKPLVTAAVREAMSQGPQIHIIAFLPILVIIIILILMVKGSQSGLYHPRISIPFDTRRFLSTEVLIPTYFCQAFHGYCIAISPVCFLLS